MKTNWFRKIISRVVVPSIMINLLAVPVFADNNKRDVSGRVYEFLEEGSYAFSKAETYSPTSTSNTYGEFSIDGSIVEESTKSGVQSYKIDEGNLKILYTYNDSLLNAAKEKWHLFQDKSKKIDTFSLETAILNGAVVVQTSKDKSNWVTVNSRTNVFSDTPICNDSFYSSTDMQLINGCFYRVIVAYETRKKVDPTKVWFLSFDNFEFIKHTEVYEFYAYTDSGDIKAPDPSKTYNIGSKVRTNKFDGYYGEKIIKKSDDHYGWDLGSFFVSGYTSKVLNDEDDVVFLKNVGDKVTLWFNLKQNIDAITGNNNIKVTPDNEGYDQYFETPKTDFGRGTLIIRYTDYNNISTEPQIYTNYLEANASVDADTKVQLFGEGDYEVALDYQITNDKLIDSISHYRIFFKFSVRNGDCMFYPYDVKTGSELSNSSITENGFRLDLAKSKYLTINLKRELLKDSADGLVEDTRFNGPAKDGYEYTTEGIYTITANNEYTGSSTEKKIYVGQNKVLRAHMVSGLTIPEINKLVANGAEIDKFGEITLPKITETEPVVVQTEKPEESITTTDVESIPVIASVTELEDIVDPDIEETSKFPNIFIMIGSVASGLILIIAISIIIVRKKFSKTTTNTNESETDETQNGGTE